MTVPVPLQRLASTLLGLLAGAAILFPPVALVMAAVIVPWAILAVAIRPPSGDHAGE